MRISRTLRLVAPLALSLAGSASADVWDVQFDHDDSARTENELVHGTTQMHDLAVRPGPVADQDWYLMPEKPYSSYEVILDGTSGDIDGVALDLIDEDGITVAQSHTTAVVGGVSSLALRMINLSSSVRRRFVRVSGAACGTSCGADDVYTIRVRETTVHVPRFNNSGSQATVLLVQNVTDTWMNVVVDCWTAAGAHLQGILILGLQPRQLTVFPLADWSSLLGQSGHITVTHIGGYGALAVKAVALEPTTGFSFDTPGVYVPD